MAASRNDNRYRTNGTAAYQESYNPYNRESTARPLHQPKTVPQQRPRKAKVVREKIAIAPFGVLGVAIALSMLVLVLFGYVQIYEVSSRVADLQEQYANLQEENKKLQTQFDNAVDLEQIEIRAKELGMQQPSAKQTISVRVPAADVTVISQQTHSSVAESAVRAVYETAMDLLEYLRLR